MPGKTRLQVSRVMRRPDFVVFAVRLHGPTFARLAGGAGVEGVTAYAGRRRITQGPNAPLLALAERAGQLIGEAYEELDRSYLETVKGLAGAMEAKDHFTAAHADKLAEMATHTIIGEGIISRIDYLRPVAQLVRSAHELWDGKGYPDGLAGEDIPLAARIIFVCDAFHAMTSDRPYRNGLPLEISFDELRADDGRQFDSGIVEVFLEVGSSFVADAKVAAANRVALV